MKKIKLFTLFSIVFLLLIVPATFAVENDTVLESSHDNQGLLAADYYFDANAVDDSGNGSVNNPYKALTNARIKDNSNIHLASGEYTLNGYKTIKNVTFIGSSASDTIVSYYGTCFEVRGSLTLKNITLNNLIVKVNNGTLNAEDVIFTGGATSSDGGAIYSTSDSDIINLNNCIFQTIHANHGGAIFTNGAILNITDCLFNNTYSEFYGGAIAAKSDALVEINNTIFSNTYSKNDAGGAIYIVDSALNAENFEIINSTANFGGAITALKSYVYLKNFTARLNNAKYYGGALYALYREVEIYDSLFDGNSAVDGGAVYACGVDSFWLESNQFISNDASNSAGAVYSLKNFIYYDSILDDELNNTFIGNTPTDVYESDEPAGYIIEGGSDLLIKYNPSYNGTLPSSYDLRSLGYVTPVKNQGSGNGNCWAFATMAVLESNILKATGIEMDLSEDNIKNLMASYSIYGWQLETDKGAYDDMGYSYITGWLGPVNESDDDYKIGSVLSPILSNIIQVQNVCFINRNNYTDNDDLKKAIMDYGAVHSAIYYEAKYLKGNDYYNPNSHGSNHATAIVGWDDEREIAGAPGKGAWIVKNSWGSSWKDKGYFYVSYYDANFATSLWTFVLNDTIRYDKNYQYDISGITDYYINSSSTVWYKTRYTSTDNECLAGVSTYFKKETDWELYAYVNGELKQTLSGVSSSGYWTFKLNQFVPLKVGDVFETAFKITVDGDAAFPISEAIRFTENYFRENMSFVSYDGENWEDLFYKGGSYSGHTYYGNQVACIKAFTIVNSDVNLSAVYSNFELVVSLINNDTGAPLNGSSVVVNIGGKNYTVEMDSKGEGRLSLADFEFGPYHVDVSYNGNITYNPASVSLDIIVAYEVNLSAVYDGSSNELVVSLVDAVSGSALKGASVDVNVGGKDYTVKINSAGEGRLYLADLASGTHVATVSYKGNASYAPASTNVDVFVKFDSRISAVYDDIAKELTVTLVNDANGAPLKGASVVVNVDGVKHTVKINGAGNGVVSLADLALGTYDVDVSYSGGAKCNPSNTSLQIVTKYNSRITAFYNDATKELTVRLVNDATGAPISGASVVVNVGGKNYTAKINGAGKAVVSLADLASGTYVATVSYNGGTKCNPSSAKVNVIVKFDSRISAVYDDITKKLTVTLVNDATGAPLSGASVVVDVGGVKYTVKINSKGKGVLSLADLALGTYDVTVTYNGGTKCNPSNTSLQIVSKYNSRISAVYNDATKALTVTLVNDANGAPLSGASVVVNVGGVKYTAKINGAGKGVVYLANLAPGTYVANVSYNGGTKCNPSSTSVNVVVKS